MNDSLLELFRRIEIIIADVDGTLTDGGIIIDENGNEAKCFSARDGLASNLFVRTGRKFAIITGRSESNCVKRRAREMSATHVIYGSRAKDVDIRKLCKEVGVDVKNAAFIGDDIPDLPALREAGLRVAVADAADEVKAIAHYVTSNAGGKGALRDLIECIMKAQGTWESSISK